MQTPEEAGTARESADREIGLRGPHGRIMPPVRRRPRARYAIRRGALAALVFLMVASCGDDDPVAPPPPADAKHSLATAAQGVMAAAMATDTVRTTWR